MEDWEIEDAFRVIPGETTTPSAYFKRWIYPFVFVIYFGIFGVLLYWTEHFCFGIILFASWFYSPILYDVFFSSFFDYTLMEFDDKEITFFRSKTFINRRNWVCKISFQDIAMIQVSGRKDTKYSIVLKNSHILPLRIIHNIKDLTTSEPITTSDDGVGSFPLASDKVRSKQMSFFKLFNKIHAFIEYGESRTIPLRLPRTNYNRRESGYFFENNKVIVARSQDPTSLDQSRIWKGLHYGAPPHTPGHSLQSIESPFFLISYLVWKIAFPILLFTIAGGAVLLVLSIYEGSLPDLSSIQITHETISWGGGGTISLMIIGAIFLTLKRFGKQADQKLGEMALKQYWERP